VSYHAATTRLSADEAMIVAMCEDLADIPVLDVDLTEESEDAARAAFRTVADAIRSGLHRALALTPRSTRIEA
jgi:hypothetical protein